MKKNIWRVIAFIVVALITISSAIAINAAYRGSAVPLLMTNTGHMCPKGGEYDVQALLGSEKPYRWMGLIGFLLKGDTVFWRPDYYIAYSYIVNRSDALWLSLYCWGQRIPINYQVVIPQ